MTAGIPHDGGAGTIAGRMAAGVRVKDEGLAMTARMRWRAPVIARSAATKQSSGAVRVFWIASLRSQSRLEARITADPHMTAATLRDGAGHAHHCGRRADMTAGIPRDGA
jgi:hypothetical protein